VKLCRQNGGRLSKRKRELPEFIVLTEGEIAALEEMVCEGLGFSIGLDQSS
jgi:hypothetical protein